MMPLPEPTGTFRWAQTPAGPALVCDTLTPSAAHLFTTRPWKLGSATSADHAEGWREVAAAVDVDPGDLVRVHQVHGASVVVVRRRGSAQSLPGPGLPDADILITQDPAVALAIQMADCVPILIADRKTGAVAAAHAGWRGLAAGVPTAAVDALEREFGTRPEDLIAAVGPSISAARYEIDETVLARFEKNGFSTEHIGRWFYDGDRPDHWFFDGAQSANDQLTVAGIPPGQIYVARLCTATHTDLLCSYRRDGRASGRMAAVIRAPG
jgi:purine-nucleoside/S-methyl-5'-thioadenosine phosphorylase / adenosine deaminase